MVSDTGLYKTSENSTLKLNYPQSMKPAIVMLIDDDVMFNFIHSQVVKSAKLDVKITAYQDAARALEEFQTALPSSESRYIFFVDINMPGVDGWGFLEGLSQLPASFLDVCEVFVLSSSNDKTDIEKAATYPIVRGYVSKPLKIQQVQDIYRKDYTSLLFAFNR